MLVKVQRSLPDKILVNSSQDNLVLCVCFGFNLSYFQLIFPHEEGVNLTKSVITTVDIQSTTKLSDQDPNLLAYGY